MATIAQAQTYVDAANAAADAGNYDLAIRKASLALSTYGGIAGSQSKDGSSMSFSATIQALQIAIREWRLLKASAERTSAGGTGVQRTTIEWKRPTT